MSDDRNPRDPAKLTIEITADGVIQTLTANDGSQLWHKREEMESAGSMKEVAGEPLEDLDGWWGQEMAEAIDDISFGPFHVAGALHVIKYGDAIERAQDEADRKAKNGTD